MPTDMSDLDAQLRIIANNARTLRDAGVSGTVRVGDVEFTLDPPAETQPATTQQTEQHSANALDDSRTYGLPEGSQLPGFTNPRKA